MKLQWNNVNKESFDLSKRVLMRWIDSTTGNGYLFDRMHYI